VKIGSRTPITYTYTNDRNHRLSHVGYSNGDSADYAYDAYGRVTTLTWEDGDTVSYTYGTDGNLGRMTDSESGRTTKYYYDFLGRAVRMDCTGTNYGNTVQWNYNDKNELSSLRQVVHGTEYNTYYSYDNDSRLSHMNKGIVQVFFDYDGFSRLSKLSVKRYELPMVTTDITYQGGATTTSSRISTWRNKVTDATTGSNSGAVMGDTTFSYTYDAKGNITAITARCAWAGIHEAARKPERGDFLAVMQLPSKATLTQDIMRLRTMRDRREGWAALQQAAQNMLDGTKEIDETINHLNRVKDSLMKSENQLRLANDKAQDLTIRRLTRGNATMKKKFEEAGISTTAEEVKTAEPAEAAAPEETE
jgi:YD repeat-containing protein